MRVHKEADQQTQMEVGYWDANSKQVPLGFEEEKNCHWRSGDNHRKKAEHKRTNGQCARGSLIDQYEQASQPQTASENRGLYNSGCVTRWITSPEDC